MCNIIFLMPFFKKSLIVFSLLILSFSSILAPYANAKQCESPEIGGNCVPRSCDPETETPSTATCPGGGGRSGTRVACCVPTSGAGASPSPAPAGSSPTSLQSSGLWYRQGFKEWYDKVFDKGNPNEIFGERYTFAQVQWIFYSLLSLLIPDVIQECAGLNDVNACMEKLKPFFPEENPQNAPNTQGQQQQIESNNIFSGGPILAFAGMSDMLLSTPPVSGIRYVKQIAQNLRLIPVANAQGTGYTAFQDTTLVLWKATRNIAFILLILVTIVMAFMIMFRVKLSPQTVITVQSAIPQIIVTLLLITFSFAIAGFLYDIMHLVFGLIALFVSSTKLSPLSPGEIYTFFTHNSAPGLILIYTVILLVLAIVGGLVGAGTLVIPFVGAVGTALGWGAAIIFGLLAVILLICMFRVFWLLLKTYVSIVFLVILAPIQILFGAVSPNAGFGTWLRNMASNLAVFPTVGIMIVVSQLFFWGSSLQFGTGGNWLWTNPLKIHQQFFVNDIGFPMFSQSWAPAMGGISFLMSFVILFMIPHTANIIKAVLQGQQFNYGSAIGQALGPIGLGYGAGLAAGKYEAGQFVLQAGKTAGAGRYLGISGKLWGRLGNVLKNSRWIP